MNYYQFLHDESELDKYLSILRKAYKLEKDEVFQIYLFSRNKYLTPEQKAVVDLSRANVVNRQIIDSLETKDVVKALRKMECAFGAYTDRSGNPLPQNALIPYISYNPVSPITAFADTQRCFVEYMIELNNAGDKTDVYNRLKKIDSQYRTQLHHAFSRKLFIDVDFDFPDREYGNKTTTAFVKRLAENGVEAHRVETRGGYHVLINKSTIKYNWNIELMRAQATAGLYYPYDSGVKWEIEINKNEQLPMPGTIVNGDHLVKVV